MKTLLFFVALLATSLPVQTPDTAVSTGPDRAVDAGHHGLPVVEPYLVASPDDAGRLAGAAVRVDGSHWQVFAFATDDGGNRWWSRELAGLDDVHISADPWLHWSPDGTLWLSVLAFVPAGDGERVAIWVYTSTDGGDTWSGPSQLPWTERGSFDHAVLASGDGPGAPMYAVATYGLSGFLVLRSPGGAGDFRIAGELAPDELNNNLGGVVAWDDRVVFTHFDMSTPGERRPLWAVRSGPGGGDLERTLITRGVVPWGFPMLAAIPSRTTGPPPLLSVWLQAAGADGLDVMLARSDDGGATWAAPVRVNDDSVSTFRGRPQVAARGDGVVVVSWNDRRNNTGDRCSDVYAAVSLDGGAGFLPERRISSETTCPFETDDPRPAQRWPMGGDYVAVAVGADGTFHVIWSEARDGRFGLRIVPLRVATQTR